MHKCKINSGVLLASHKTPTHAVQMITIQILKCFEWSPNDFSKKWKSTCWILIIDNYIGAEPKKSILRCPIHTLISKELLSLFSAATEG